MTNFKYTAPKGSKVSLAYLFLKGKLCIAARTIVLDQTKSWVLQKITADRGYPSAECNFPKSPFSIQLIWPLTAAPEGGKTSPHPQKEWERIWSSAAV